MSITGKFVGPGIYISELEQTFSFKEIEKINFKDFKQLTGFMNEKELHKLMFNLDDINQDLKYSYLQNIYSKII